MSLTSTSTKSARLWLYALRKSALNGRNRYLSTSSTSEIFDSDVVIVGGGPAGLALASALGSSSFVKSNISITLVEGGDLNGTRNWQPAPGTFSNRVVSLTNASQAFLRDIGAWKHVEDGRTCTVEQLQVWDGVSDARIEFCSEDLPSEISKSGMSRMTENFNLQRALLRHLDETPEVQILQRTKVTSIEQDSEDRGSWPLVRLDNGKVIRARLLVGADGFNSPVRAFAKIPSYGWSYDTQAIVATMIHSPRGAFEGPNTTCYQRFLPTGPIAFLPLSPTASSLVWSTRPSLASALQAADPDVLAIMINAAFRLPDVSMGYLNKFILDAHTNGTPLSPAALREEIQWRERSHSIDQHSAYSSATNSGQPGIPPADSEAVPPLVRELQVGSIASFPLRYNHADSYLGEGLGARTVLIGDAAHTVHPLAGQGLNLGLADAECLSKCIQNSLASGGDIGSYTALLPYSQERYLANHILMSSVDKLHKLYSTDNEAVVWARSIGVEVLNELDSVKAALMMTAGARKSTRATADVWNIAGDIVQTLASTVKTASVVKGVLGNAVGSALNQLVGRSGRP